MKRSKLGPTGTLPLFQDLPRVHRLAVMLYIRFPLSQRNVEDLLHERGIEVSHETAVLMERVGPGLPLGFPAMFRNCLLMMFVSFRWTSSWRSLSAGQQWLG